MLETFRQSLVDYATRSWAEKDLWDVRLREGGQLRMYVTPFSLAGPFRSILAGFLTRPVAREGYRATGTFPVPRSDFITVTPNTQPETGVQKLQSAGGQNRFLAIDPADGATYSVGKSNGEMVEWRPFWCESVIPALPGTTLTLHATDLQCDVEQAAHSLM